jgi:hypothetical protein
MNSSAAAPIYDTDFWKLRGNNGDILALTAA